MSEPSIRTDPWKWPRRALMALALAAAIAFVVVTLAKSPESTSHPGAAADPAIVAQSPAPGTHVLRQTPVGAKLLTGYDGRLTVNGVAIPEDQMDGAASEGSPAYDPRYGVRPNNKELVFFTPGPGKVIDHYDSGEVHVTVRFWRIADGESHARTISWAFFVN